MGDNLKVVEWVTWHEKLVVLEALTVPFINSALATSVEPAIYNA